MELYWLESWNGKLRISHSNNMGKTAQLKQWIAWSMPSPRMRKSYAEYTVEWESNNFAANWNAEEKALALPHWMWAAFLGLFAFLVKTHPKTQFNFFELLALIAIFAILFRVFGSPIYSAW
jgi:hypothetical protein